MRMNEAAQVTGRTGVYGLLGHPIAGSLSPPMHNAAMRALGLDAVYVPFPVLPEHLAEAVAGLRRAGVLGFNLTVPHKTAILPLLDEVTASAARIGAVNTVKIASGRLLGTNTDGAGVLNSLAEDLDWRPKGQTLVLLGAGGAARGIAFSLLDAGLASLIISNRTLARAEALVKDCQRHHPQREIRAIEWPTRERAECDLLLNATTLGMGAQGSPVDIKAMTIRRGVLDIVYHPPETPLLAQAHAAGLPCANGLGMLLHQGCAALEYWVGQPAPVAVMRQALLERV